MPTVKGRRCPRCGGPVSTIKGGGKPLDKLRHSETDYDSCAAPGCGWESTSKLPEAKAAPEGVAPEDVPN